MTEKKLEQNPEGKNPEQDWAQAGKEIGSIMFWKVKEWKLFTKVMTLKFEPKADVFTVNDQPINDDWKNVMTIRDGEYLVPWKQAQFSNLPWAEKFFKVNEQGEVICDIVAFFSHYRETWWYGNRMIKLWFEKNDGSTHLIWLRVNIMWNPSIQLLDDKGKSGKEMGITVTWLDKEWNQFTKTMTLEEYIKFVGDPSNLSWISYEVNFSDDLKKDMNLDPHKWDTEIVRITTSDSNSTDK